MARLENTPSETLNGIAVFVAGSALMPAFDALAKVIVSDHGVSPGQIAATRLLIQAAICLPLLLMREGRRGLAVRHPLIHLVRGACLGLGGVAFFGALRFMPLADATTIFFVEPMIVTVLSAIFLSETIGWRRIAAVLTGFAGALLIIQPNFAAFGWNAFLPVAAAFAVSCYLVLTRLVSRTASPISMMFWAGVGGFLFVAATLAVGDPLALAELSVSFALPAMTWGLIAAASLLGTIGHLTFVIAFKLAPGSVLAPFGYLEIVVSVTLGYLVFGDFPDASKWIGIVVIVGSGIAIYLRERKLSRVAANPVAPTP